jgi:sugar phosphate isomerase/epimerase
MYYTGFADEAGDSLAVQIQATKALGWSSIEARNIDKVNLTDITDAQFDTICAQLAAAKVKINCFGSAVANWGKQPRNAADVERSFAELRRALPRMQRLGTPMLRGMSFAVAKDEPPDNPELEALIFKNVQALVDLCAEVGVLYLHENCMNYGGMSHEHTLKLLDRIKSPNFKLVFDTGNPVFTDRRIGPPPYRKQSSWEFYTNVREFIHYVHIKDCQYRSETAGIFPEVEFTFPGEGDGDVVRIVADLLNHGYAGGFSIEPHLAVVSHDATVQSAEDIRYANYIEYGRRFMQLIEKIRVTE